MTEASSGRTVQQWYKSQSPFDRDKIRWQIHYRQDTLNKQILPFRIKHQPELTVTQAQHAVLLEGYYLALDLLFKAYDLELSSLTLKITERGLLEKAAKEATRETERVQAVSERGYWRFLKQKWIEQITEPKEPESTNNPPIDRINISVFRETKIRFDQCAAAYDFAYTQRLLNSIPDFTNPLNPIKIDPNPVIPIKI